MNYKPVNVIALCVLLMVILCLPFIKASGKSNPIQIDETLLDNDTHSLQTDSSSKRSGKEILGTATWTFLHRLAGMYPANPDAKYQEYVRLFINTLPYIYPCEECAVGMRAFFDCHPPETESMEKFGAWLCMIHNLVNEKLGKPQYNCTNWMEEWRPEDCTSCHLSDTTMPPQSIEDMLSSSPSDEAKVFKKKNA